MEQCNDCNHNCIDCENYIPSPVYDYEVDAKTGEVFRYRVE